MDVLHSTLFLKKCPSPDVIGSPEKLRGGDSRHGVVIGELRVSGLRVEVSRHDCTDCSSAILKFYTWNSPKYFESSFFRRYPNPA